ncbi:hypothetical protein EXIGLDRAFT_780816 [Exidia glandulosa HHB12029]|uniref:Uncharacterized protein n=1 Tax=Exidia glandulosa HHB12029 TaxID=1314781 RepID=A0A165BFX7_EXIGL|nr:hypothetical protein EXIGLDRAFT_780816 [Exidia glandulosa HHB12029]
MSLPNSQELASPPSYTPAAPGAPVAHVLPVPTNSNAAYVSVLNELLDNARRVLNTVVIANRNTVGVGAAVDGLAGVIDKVQHVLSLISDGITDIHDHVVDVWHLVEPILPFLERNENRVLALMSTASVLETGINMLRASNDNLRGMIANSLAGLGRIEEVVRRSDTTFGAVLNATNRNHATLVDKALTLGTLVDVASKNVASTVEGSKNEVVAVVAVFRAEVADVVKVIQKEMEALRVHQGELADAMYEFMKLGARTGRAADVVSPGSPLSPLTPSPTSSTAASTSGNSPMRLAKVNAATAISTYYRHDEPINVDEQDELID